MEIGWTDVGSREYILVSCAHGNTSLIKQLLIVCLLRYSRKMHLKNIDSPALMIKSYNQVKSDIHDLMFHNLLQNCKYLV
jgi:hypothetical protein